MPFRPNFFILNYNDMWKSEKTLIPFVRSSSQNAKWDLKLQFFTFINFTIHMRHKTIKYNF